MRERQLIHRITTGTLTLPTATLIAAAIWLLPGIADKNLWGGLAVTGLAAYFLVEHNNRNALLRVRSRMMGTTFLMLSAACPELHRWDFSMLPGLCLIAAYFPLFASYQKDRTASEVMHAFALVSIGSFVYPPLLLLQLLFYFCLGVQLRALNRRSFFAGLIGAFLPYWLYLGYAVWADIFPEAFLPFAEAFLFTPPDYSVLLPWQIVSAAFVGLLSLASIFHLLRTAYNDKIRTRMFFYAITLTECVLLAATALQPQRFNVLFPLLLANSSPLIAHYFTLARGRWINLWFVCCLLALGGLIAFNYIMLWNPFLKLW